MLLLALEAYNIHLGLNFWLFSLHHIQVSKADTQCSKTHIVHYPHPKTTDSIKRLFVVGQHVVDGPRYLEDSFST